MTSVDQGGHPKGYTDILYPDRSQDLGGQKKGARCNFELAQLEGSRLTQTIWEARVSPKI